MNGTTNGAHIDEDSWRASFANEPPREDAPASGVRLLFGPDLAEPLPPIEYLCSGLGMVAGGGAPHIIAGYGFSGKTVAAQAMCLSLAAGRAVWGAFSVPQTRVAHVDAEQGDRLTRRRYQRLARAAGIDLAELGDNIAVTCMPNLLLSKDAAAPWRDLMAGRGVLVIDSFRAVVGNLDENSSEARGPLDLLGQLSEDTKCRAVVLVHASKPSDARDDDKYKIRGSSAIFDASDSAYVFAASRGEPVSVRQVKARSHGEPIEDFALVIEDVEYDADPKWGLAVKVHGREIVQQRREEAAQRENEARGASDAKAVEKALVAHPGLGTRELRAVTGLGGDRLTRAVVALGDRVRIDRVREGRALVVRHFLNAGDRPS